MDDKVSEAVEASDREIARWRILPTYTGGPVLLTEVGSLYDGPTTDAAAVAATLRRYECKDEEEARRRLRHITMEAALKAVGAL